MKVNIVNLQGVLDELEQHAKELVKDAHTHRIGTEIRTRWESRSVGIRLAINRIEAEIQREAERIVEAGE